MCTSIFISYSQKDKEYLDIIVEFLSSLERQKSIKLSYDKKILKAGDPWEKKLLSTLNNSDVAILLISTAFLASDFIRNIELPAIIDHFQQNKIKVLPIIIDECNFDLTKIEFRDPSSNELKEFLLSELQAVNDPEEPLSKIPKTQLNTLLRKLSKQLLSIGGTESHVASSASQSFATKIPLFRRFFDLVIPKFHTYFTKHFGTQPQERRSIETHLKELKTSLLNPSGLRKFNPDDYIDLNASQMKPPKDILLRSNKSSVRNQGIFNIRREIRLVAGHSGYDHANAQLAAISRKSKVITNISSELRKTKEPLVLLGDPGTGKTMTLLQVCHSIIEDELKKVYPSLLVYMRLGNFRAKTSEAIWEFVTSNVYQDARDLLEKLRDVDRLILIFDGMDEMPRDHYSDYVKALSDFAETNLNIKMLFSCRINDFSPAFQHRQLVLLPFEKHQIKEYLESVLSFPIEINGKQVDCNQLFDVIIDELPTKGEISNRMTGLQMNNPFVLYLFCEFIQSNQRLPISRADLMLSYFESRYLNNKDKLKISFSDTTQSEQQEIEKIFDGWGKIAYTIAIRNAGTAILEIEAIQAFENANFGKELTNAAVLCGVLVQDEGKETEDDPGKFWYRFEHHRYEEFFTAWYLSSTYEHEVNWLRYLDSPKWQETLLYLISLRKTHEASKADEAIQILADSITLPYFSEHRNNKYGFDSDEFDDMEYVFSDDLTLSSIENQAFLADRVELAALVLKEQRTNQSDVSHQLLHAYQSALRFLTEYGNPITQVKMITAITNFPIPESLEILQEPLQSPVRWVREQALIAYGSLNNLMENKSSQTLWRELGRDIARSFWLKNSFQYIKAIKNAK